MSDYNATFHILAIRRAAHQRHTFSVSLMLAVYRRQMPPSGQCCIIDYTTLARQVLPIPDEQICKHISTLVKCRQKYTTVQYHHCPLFWSTVECGGLTCHYTLSPRVHTPACEYRSTVCEPPTHMQYQYKHKNNRVLCVSRDSNPGRNLGRVASYPWTTDAVEYPPLRTS